MHLRSTRGAYTHRRFSGLHWESFFEIVELVIAFMGAKGCVINQGYCASHTPLPQTAKNEHGEVDKPLLGRRNLDPNRLDKGDNTPLLWKGHNGNKGAVKLLLRRKDVDPGPNHPDENDRTPFRRAAVNGREGVAKLFIKPGCLTVAKMGTILVRLFPHVAWQGEDLHNPDLGLKDGRGERANFKFEN